MRSTRAVRGNDWRLGVLGVLGVASACASPPPSIEPGMSAAIDSSAELESGLRFGLRYGAPVGDGVPVIVVEQQRIPQNPTEWRYSPASGYVATELGDTCGVWTYEGSFAGYAEDPTSANPCAAWLEGAHEPPRRSPDGRFAVSQVDRALMVEIPGREPLRLPCARRTCPWAWAPDGVRIAFATDDAIKVWDLVAPGAVDKVALPGGDPIVDLLLAWPDEEVVVVAVREAPDEDEDEDEEDGDDEDEEDGDDEDEGFFADEPATSLYAGSWLPGSGGGLHLATISNEGDLRSPTGDPRLDWVFVASEQAFERSGIDVELRAFPLEGSGEGLGWTSLIYSDTTERISGRWRVDGRRTSFVEGLHTYSDYGDVTLAWEALTVAPTLARASGELFSRADIEAIGVELQPFGPSASAIAWSVSWDEDEVASGGPDEVLDLTPSLDRALVVRDGALGLAGLDGAGFTPLRRLPGSPEGLTWAWGAGDRLAVFVPGAGVEILDVGAAKRVADLPGAVALVPSPLGPEQGRFAVRFADRTGLIDAADGRELATIPVAAEAAALDPSGQRFAALADGAVHVVELATAAQTRFPVAPSSTALAWRQDGAVLFTGQGWPTHAYAPDTGEPLGIVQHWSLDEYADIDPSWRWVHHGTYVTRLLDFSTLTLAAEGAWLDTGWVDGKLDDFTYADEESSGLGWFRVTLQPDTVPCLEVAALGDRLRRPGLAQAFFEGEPLPIPTVPAALADELACPPAPKRLARE